MLSHPLRDPRRRSSVRRGGSSTRTIGGNWRRWPSGRPTPTGSSHYCLWPTLASSARRGCNFKRSAPGLSHDCPLWPSSTHSVVPRHARAVDVSDRLPSPLTSDVTTLAGSQPGDVASTVVLLPSHARLPDPSQLPSQNSRCLFDGTRVPKQRISSLVGRLTTTQCEPVTFRAAQAV